MNEPISQRQALDYEIRSHWLASWVSFKRGQLFLGRYFAWKVRIKHDRYNNSLNEAKRLAEV